MISFPADPDIDEVYTFMGISWMWNGVGWAYRPSADFWAINFLT